MSVFLDFEEIITLVPHEDLLEMARLIKEEAETRYSDECGDEDINGNKDKDEIILLKEIIEKLKSI